jgi:hypothetical protein
VVLDIEDLVAIHSPARRASPMRGDLPLVHPTWKAPHIDLVPARLVGLVSHKLPIGRKSRSAFIERSFQKDYRIAEGPVFAPLAIEQVCRIAAAPS